MSTQTSKKPSVDETRIGEHAAQQPLSGIVRVDQSGIVNGLGRAAYMRSEETGKKPAGRI